MRGYPRDHQLFETHNLPNGITLYTYRDNFRTTHLEIVLPIGSGHSHSGNSMVPGSVHFLEHVQLIRSQKFPVPYQLDQELGLRAGHSDGTTYPTHTIHWINVPSGQYEFGKKAILDRVFFPIFHQEDIETEKGVIINERNQHKFYPGRNQVSQYYYTNFLNDVFFPLEQIFGSDQDLANLNVTNLEQLHKIATHNKEVKVLAVGRHDFTELKKCLSQIPTESNQFITRVNPTTWTKRSYHQVYFESITQPTLRVTWIHPRLNYREFQAVSFLVSLMINTTQGPLYREFREEKGWVYSLDGFTSQRHYNTLCGFTFPVNQSWQMDYILENLADRLTKASLDQDLIQKEITRHLGNQVYFYQTPGEIIASASQELITYGEIHTEEEWRQSLIALADPAWRQEVVRKYFDIKQAGAIGLLPERRKMVPARQNNNNAKLPSQKQD